MLIWRLCGLDHRIASVRYRALLPIEGLSAYGYRSVIGKCGYGSLIEKALRIDQLQGADAVIFVRAFTLKDLAFAQRASGLGVPIVLDVCDNIFVPNCATNDPLHQTEIFQVMARYASAITTPGPALASVLQEVLEMQVPVMVVSDGIESEMMSRKGQQMIRRAYWREVRVPMLMKMSFWMGVIPKLLSKVRTRVVQWRKNVVMPCRNSITDRQRARSPVIRRVTEIDKSTVKTLIWFGRSGGDSGRLGLSDIVDVAAYLEQVARRIEIQLVVVSDNREAYETLVQPLPIETRYVEWDIKSIRGVIKASDLAIIPNSRDPVAICKSANRAVLPLSLGIPVVASRTPAMEVLAECVCLDDWVEGIYRYLTEPDLVQNHLRRAQSILQREFGLDRIARQWQAVLRHIKSQTGRGDQVSVDVHSGRIVVVINTEYDLEPALVTLREARCWDNMRCQAWVSMSLLETCPRLWKGLREHGAEFRVLDDQSDADLALVEFGDIEAVVTIAEANRAVFQFARSVATRARSKGIPIYTLKQEPENLILAAQNVIRNIAEALGRKFANEQWSAC
jgi:glycosyltransferase involved in cell wall biosynthesis